MLYKLVSCLYKYMSSDTQQSLTKSQTLNYISCTLHSHIIHASEYKVYKM